MLNRGLGLPKSPQVKRKSTFSPECKKIKLDLLKVDLDLGKITPESYQANAALIEAEFLESQSEFPNLKVPTYTNPSWARTNVQIDPLTGLKKINPLTGLKTTPSELSKAAIGNLNNDINHSTPEGPNDLATPEKGPNDPADVSVSESILNDTGSTIKEALVDPIPNTTSGSTLDPGAPTSGSGVWNNTDMDADAKGLHMQAKYLVLTIFEGQNAEFIDLTKELFQKITAALGATFARSEEDVKQGLPMAHYEIEADRWIDGQGSYVVTSSEYEAAVQAHVLKLRLPDFPEKRFRAFTEKENPEYLLTIVVSHDETKIPIKKFLLDLKFNNGLPGKLTKASWKKWQDDNQHRSQLNVKCDTKLYNHLLERADRKHIVKLKMGFRRWDCRVSYPLLVAQDREKQRLKELADRNAVRQQERDNAKAAHDKAEADRNAVRQQEREDAEAAHVKAVADAKALKDAADNVTANIDSLELNRDMETDSTENGE